MIRWFADLPIERKLRVVITVPAITAFAIAMLMHLATNVLHVREAMELRASRIAHLAGETTLEALQLGDEKAAAHALGMLRDEPTVNVAEIYATDGKRIATYDRASNAVHLEAPMHSDALPSQEKLIFDAKQPRLFLRGRVVHITVAAVREGQILGFVHIMEPLDALLPDWREYFLIMLAAIAAAVLASYWLAARLQQQISGPIVNLAHTMKRVSAEEDYTLRVERNSQDEIGSLIDGFNQMLAQIRHRDSRLEKYRTFLEQQVADRTENLGNANRELQAAIEEATRAKEAAERASTAKSDFLARMSHEIRTPMNGVMGMSEVLQGTELTQRQRHLSETISHSAEALLRIINDILDFSKVEAGKLVLEHVEFGLRETLEETMEIFAARAHAKGIELVCAMETDIPAQVRGDPMRLRQVLVNLIGNAIKFTDSGEVVVRVKTVAEDGLLRFEVIDTGIGISKDAQAQIFSAFHQADSFTSRQYGGTGLGLAICRQLATLMGGEIGVHSEPNRGSTFWFELPLEPIADATPTFPRLPRLNLDGLRALIVDDNASNGESLMQHLNSWGITAVCVASSLTALDLLAADEIGFNVALLDDEMPGMNGIELAQLIRSDARWAQLRLIRLTSTDDHGSEPAGAEAFTAVLVKPLRRSQVYSCLSKAMSGLHGRPYGNDVNDVSVKPAVAAETTLGPKILVVEDNAVNREVAVGMLESLGCRTCTAQNGLLAIEAVDHDVFDAILMDCQMPVLDGLSATAELRRREQSSGMARIPIIALTANAMEGDREHCLASGMDDFLSKPFTQQQLATMLKRWLALRVLPESERRESSKIPLIDARVLSNITALAKPALLNSMIDLYLKHSPELLRSIETAAADMQAEALYEAVHTLKSSTANLGGTRLAAVVKECEVLAREGGITQVSPIVPRIRKEYQDFCDALLHERSSNAA